MGITVLHALAGGNRLAPTVRPLLRSRIILRRSIPPDEGSCLEGSLQAAQVTGAAEAAGAVPTCAEPPQVVVECVCAALGWTRVMRATTSPPTATQAARLGQSTAVKVIGA